MPQIKIKSKLFQVIPSIYNHGYYKNVDKIFVCNGNYNDKFAPNLTDIILYITIYKDYECICVSEFNKVVLRKKYNYVHKKGLSLKVFKDLLIRCSTNFEIINQ